MKNRKRNRMQGFDYSSENLYFVTICVKDRKCCFGSVISVGTGRDLSVRNPNEINENEINENEINENEINENEINENEINENEINPYEINENEINENEINKKMELNKFGQIVYDRIIWLAEQYQYVELHNFVVMPNHVHAIIGIVGTGRDLSVQDLSVQDLSVQDLSVQDLSVRDLSVQDLSVGEIIIQDDDEIKIKSLSSLIGAFKTTSSKMIHQEGFLDFAWQRSFHDHIIRNDKSYSNISNYIDANPERWEVDTFFEKN